MTKKEKSKARPQALNTVEMLRAASSGLGTHSLSHHACRYNQFEECVLKNLKAKNIPTPSKARTK